jgi:phosphate transport system substrate-binding protein
MVNREASVLIIHSSTLQAELWEAALQSQNIAVILESPEVSLNEMTEGLAVSDEATPALLLVDLGLRSLNAYELCRWCREHRPQHKIVLTSGLYHQTKASPVRQWAIEQGADELLPWFDINSLTSSTLMCLDRVMGVLKEQVPDKEALIAALMAYCKNTRLTVGEQPPLQLFDAFDSISPASSALTHRNQPPSLRRIEQNAPENSSELSLEFQAPELSRREPLIPSQPPLQTTVTRMSQDRYLLWGELPKWLPVVLGIGLVGLLTAFAAYWGSRQAIDRMTQVEPQRQADGKTTFQSIANNIPKGLFSYGGSTSWALIREQVWPKLESIAPDFQLRYTESLKESPGSNTGIKMLLAGDLDFAVSSRSLRKTEYEDARQRGFTLVQYPVAIDGIAIVVHPSVEVPGLTLEQLRQIYIGELTNWSELGGVDLPIQAFSRQPQESGTANYFQENVLKDQPFGSEVTYFPTTTAAIRQLRETPGAIYYSSAPTVITQCEVTTLSIGKSANSLIPPYQRASQTLPSRCLNQRNQVDVEAYRAGKYPLTRKLYVVVKQDKTPSEQSGEAYARLLLTEQGQEAIARAGFLRIR